MFEVIETFKSFAGTKQKPSYKIEPIKITEENDDGTILGIDHQGQIFIGQKTFFFETEKEAQDFITNKLGKVQ